MLDGKLERLNPKDVFFHDSNTGDEPMRKRWDGSCWWINDGPPKYHPDELIPAKPHEPRVRAEFRFVVVPKTITTKARKRGTA